PHRSLPATSAVSLQQSGDPFCRLHTAHRSAVSEQHSSVPFASPHLPQYTVAATGTVCPSTEALSPSSVPVESPAFWQPTTSAAATANIQIKPNRRDITSHPPPSTFQTSSCRRRPFADCRGW